MPELPKPCDQIKGAFKDPVVNQAALRALKNSVFSTIEFGFFVSKAPRGKFKISSDIFTTGGKRRIDGQAIIDSRPEGAILFIHTHPNNVPPSPVGEGDRRAAAALGIPVAAIDKAKNLSCTRG